MIRNNALRRTLAVAGALAIVALSHAADTEVSPAKNAASADYVAGQKAVEAKQWSTAADHFRRATLQDPKNADAWNMLGYSSRWAGKYPEAFDAYGRALALEPHHRGANSYLGVAYVRTDNLVKAKEQLAKLDGICGKDCDEYKLLAKAIAEYKPK
jgi:Flp pilus assembly protein TadD